MKTRQFDLHEAAFAWHGKHCGKCGESNEALLHVHHRHYQTYKRETKEDVVVLCKTCHADLHARNHAHALTIADIPFVDPEWAEFILAGDLMGLATYQRL